MAKMQVYGFGWGPLLRSQDRPGRPAKVPETFQKAMDDFMELSGRWLHRYHEAWFGFGNAVLEYAVGAVEYKDALAQYNDAISRIEAIAACADEGKKKLENGKTLAERHLMQIKLKQEPKKGKKKPAKGKAEAKQKLPGKEPKKESKRKLAGKKSTSSDDEREMKKYFKGAL